MIINSMKNKIYIIIANDPPKTFRELRGFFVMIKYYRLFRRWCDIVMDPLMALAKLTSKTFPKQWRHEHLECLEKVLSMIAEVVLSK